MAPAFTPSRIVQDIPSTTGILLRCTHTSMTRLYDPQSLCSRCRCPGPCGWVYACTQDREDMIEQEALMDQVETFDALGEQLVRLLGPRKGSPRSRQGNLSFLQEITLHQLDQYTPAQLAQILEQRENVRIAVAFQQAYGNHDHGLYEDSNQFIHDMVSSISEPGNISLCQRSGDVCNYRVCSQCQPMASKKALLSLDAVANDEMLPTAATGYGFHVLQQRPVVDARIWQRFGHLSNTSIIVSESFPEYSFGSGNTLLKILEGQILRGWQAPRGSYQSVSSMDDYTRSDLSLGSYRGHSSTTGSLKRSPQCRNLSAYSKESLPLSESTSRLHARGDWLSKFGFSQGKLSTSSTDAARSDSKSTLNASPNVTPTPRRITPSPLKVRRRRVPSMDESLCLGLSDVIIQA